MKNYLLLLMLFAFSCGYSQGWKLISEQKNGTYFYKPNTDDTAWVKLVSDKTEYFDKTSKKTKIIDGYTLILWKFDCSSKKIGIIQVSTYLKGGEVVDSFNQNELLVDLNYVNPDSVGESLLEAFCESK